MALRGCERKIGFWSAEEDAKLRKLVEEHGTTSWAIIRRFISGRSGKSCRLRWYNQISPEINHGPFNPEEDQLIIELQEKHGNRWADIARLLSGRTENSVKNRWHTCLKHRLYTGTAGKSGSIEKSVKNRRHNCFKQVPQRKIVGKTENTEKFMKNRRHTCLMHMSQRKTAGKHKYSAGGGESSGSLKRTGMGIMPTCAALTLTTTGSALLGPSGSATISRSSPWGSSSSGTYPESPNTVQSLGLHALMANSLANFDDGIDDPLTRLTLGRG